MNNKTSEQMTKEEIKLRSAYSKGLRTPEAKAAHSKYIRLKGHSRNYMRKKYADPNDDTLPKINLGMSIKRAKEYNCFVDESKEDLKKQLEIYKGCHKLNIRDGKKTWSVDHIEELALKGPHCSSNLQIIPSTDNLIKSNLLNPRIRKTKENKEIRPHQYPLFLNDKMITKETR